MKFRNKEGRNSDHHLLTFTEEQKVYLSRIYILLVLRSFGIKSVEEYDYEF